MERTALVIGASGGIGRGIATRLAGDGWDIVAHGRDAGKLEETRNAVVAAGASCRTVVAELDQERQVAELAAVADDTESLGAIVYSAGGGRAIDSGPESVGEWNRTLRATLQAPMQLTALTLPRMKRNRGSYLFICGIYAKIGMARMAAHCAGRHGLEGFVRAMFEEVREDGVGLTLLHPGFVHTPLTNTDRLDPERMIRIDDIADMAATAVNMPNNACVTEMTVRPQRSPYR